MRDIHGQVKLLGMQLGTLAKNCQVVVQVMDEQEKRLLAVEQKLTTLDSKLDYLIRCLQKQGLKTEMEEPTG